MNLAGFCRNCLSKWYKAAAQGHDRQVRVHRQGLFDAEGLGRGAPGMLPNYGNA